MHPYRFTPNLEIDRDCAEVAAFALAHRAARIQALASGLLLVALSISLTAAYAGWFWFGWHCGFECM